MEGIVDTLPFRRGDLVNEILKFPRVDPLRIAAHWVPF